MTLRKRSEDVAPKANVIERPDYTSADAHALRALESGTATREQQQRALSFIVRTICGYHDVAYRPDDRDTVFALGKQKVAQDIVWLLNTATTKATGENIAKEEGE